MDLTIFIWEYRFDSATGSWGVHGGQSPSGQLRADTRAWLAADIFVGCGMAEEGRRGLYSRNLLISEDEIWWEAKNKILI
jgi:hypothetical protein